MRDGLFVLMSLLLSISWGWLFAEESTNQVSQHHREAEELYKNDEVARHETTASVVHYWIMENKGFSLISGHEPPQDATFAFNGTYFDRDKKPVGLIRLNGLKTPELGGETLSAQVVLQEGRIALLSRDAEPEGESVFRAGPYVIDPGGLIGINRNRMRRFDRTIVALLEDGRLGVFHFQRVDLYEAALYLKTLDFPIERAVNLDGGPSAMLMSKKFVHPVDLPLPNIIIRKTSD